MNGEKNNKCLVGSKFLQGKLSGRRKERIDFITFSVVTENFEVFQETGLYICLFLTEAHLYFKASLNPSFSKISYCLRSCGNHLSNKQVLILTSCKSLRNMPPNCSVFISMCGNSGLEIINSTNLFISIRDFQKKQDEFNEMNN